MKDLQRILESGSTASIEGIEAILQEILDSGVLSAESLEQAVLFQKAMAESGTATTLHGCTWDTGHF